MPGSRTAGPLLLSAHREGSVPNGCVVVVDESGMAETRVLAPLLNLVEEADGKVILVGDPCQLPAVGAGGLYSALCEHLGAISLTDSRRQRDLSERQALARLRCGDDEAHLAHAARRDACTSMTNQRPRSIASSTTGGKRPTRLGTVGAAQSSILDRKIDRSRRSGGSRRSTSRARTSRPIVAGSPRGNCRLLV